MAAGVPEMDVFAAADAVLARGERPTVERVRIELGRGSPARVGQLLEQWWEQLARRLKAHALLPELPSEVAQAYAETWRLALAHADVSVRTSLSEEQNNLFAAQTMLAQERKLWEIALAEAQATVAEHAAQQAQAEAQLGERQTLADQLEVQRIDLLRQRDRLQTHLDQQRIELETLRAENVLVHQHVRAVEDRAHQQVDRTRQEIKALQFQLDRERREHAKMMGTLTNQNEMLRAAAHSAEQTLAHHAGHIAALEGALVRRRESAGKSGRTTRKTPASKTRTSPSKR